MKKEVIKIKGMHCVSCSQIIENGLKKNKGIKNINVSYILEKAEVEFDETKINKEKIYEEIEKSGYRILPRCGRILQFKNLEPWLMQVLPNLLQAEWLISGFVGAIFSVILVVIWSYSSKGQ